MKAEAGQRGAEVRSDLHVAIEAQGGGGVELDLKSKVALYYGDAITAQVRALLSELGVKGARVEIDDKGALPFVIAARVEAAARRAGLSKGRGGEGAARPPGERQRLRRSRLYLPGNEPKYMLNAGLYGPDAVILDLEDSVHPSEKDAARLLVKSALRELDFGRAERMVRINPLPVGGDADLAEIAPAAPDLVLLPKTETADEVKRADELIRALTDRPIWLMPIIETALGVENAFAIGRASDRVVALTLGLEDLTADLGVPKTQEGAETLHARSRVVYAARASGVAAIDSVFSDVGDLAGLEAWCRRSRALGFSGLGCLHPRQIPVVHRAFAPSKEELDKARAIVAAYEAAAREGRSVVSLGTKMIDPPVVQRALRLLQDAHE